SRPATPASRPASQPARVEVTLAVDDVFEVRVYGEADLSNTYRVTPDGSISFPLIGSVAVAGRPPAAVAREIERRLGERYLQRPQVTIFVREYHSRRFYIWGQVARPGTLAYEESMTIIDAIALAGGFTVMASENDVQITRTEDGRERAIRAPVADIRDRKAPNVPIRPGDRIYVPERFF
ncbi:MAG TPA: polysaccharide biosynthesis/export family protein, partial [Polyangia bacterium]